MQLRAFGSDSKSKPAGEATDQFAQNFPAHGVKSHFRVKRSTAETESCIWSEDI